MGVARSLTTKTQRTQRKLNLFLCVLCVFVVVFGLLIFEAGSGARLPDFDSVRQSYRESEAALLDRNGVVIHETRVNRERRRLEWVPLSEISPAVLRTVVFAEDRRFHQHRGVDWIAVIAALREIGSLSTARGASTITMQLVSKLDKTLELVHGRRSIWKKWRQLRAARSLERSWTKPQILEAYLNLVSFRGELQGIAAASRGLFRKSPHGLDDCEAVILGALIRSPNASIEATVRRAGHLAEQTRVHLASTEILKKVTAALNGPYVIPPQIALAPHAAHRLLKGRRGERLRIYSTLDGAFQRFALETLRHHLLAIRERNVHDGAVLAVENRTGDILAYVGSAGDLSSARYVDGIRALRQAGSTLKPFLYAQAFESKLLTPASLIDDSPVDIPVTGGIYRPENYDHLFHGAVTSRAALASSLNIPAVKVLELIGVAPFLDRLRQLGFRSLRPPEFYGPSLALGSADVSLWDLVNAYRALALGGISSELRLEREGEQNAPRARVFSEETCYLVSNILSDREGRSRSFSLESPLATRFWTAVKTGTSKDMRDNWCIGYSREFTVGVWIGNFVGDSMWDVSGITGAAPVWVEIMNRLHVGRPSAPPEPPARVIVRNVAFEGTDKPRREWFIVGTETSNVRTTPAAASTRIAYPAEGTIIALDPDIPVEDQKFFFEAEPADGAHSWILNGEALGSAESILLWTPKPGKYTLMLMGTGGRTIDSVHFEVRGAAIPQSRSAPQ